MNWALRLQQTNSDFGGAAGRHLPPAGGCFWKKLLLIEWAAFTVNAWLSILYFLNFILLAKNLSMFASILLRLFYPAPNFEITRFELS